MSIVEILFALVLILVVIVGILPLFMRALANNSSGFDMSQLTSFIYSGIDEFGQVGVTNGNFDDLLIEPPSDDDGGGTGDDDDDDDTISASNYYRVLQRQHRDSGARDSLSGLDFEIGDERWVAEDEDTDSPLVMWERQVELWSYHFSDIHSGTVRVDDGDPDTSDTLVVVGHPYLFDSPLEWDESEDNGQIREFRTSVESTKRGHPLGVGRSMTVSNFRAY